ncbi:flagellar motor protein MotB [Halalkalibacter urbisdiaboli]|uniref:flagellar motor protein MotB n=1 Tax=Halalkalibacter urbisdiaboli TaxID=1960589 RepID=UPI000B438604|nr:flagellar motor protein MotB [Halalkalibacter urbisdiaboli]
MAKKKQHHEEHIDETWLIPYADMLTLLLALFIVLFAVSSVDAVKYQQMMIAFNENFNGGSGIMEHPNPLPEVPVPGESKSKEDDEDLKAQEHLDLKKLQEQIDRYIEENNLSSKLKTNLSSDGLLLTILDHALFYSGSADVRPDSVELAKTISELLVTDPPRRIVVAGHTDNVPISNNHFRSNWDLSAFRALNFMKILMDNENLNPENISASGYGEYHPVASNDSAEGRAKNRRVEVMILPNYNLD